MSCRPAARAGIAAQHNAPIRTSEDKRTVVSVEAPLIDGEIIENREYGLVEPSRIRRTT